MSRKQFFSARRTVLTLILLNLLAISVAALVPQRFETPAQDIGQWPLAHPWLAPWLQGFGLDRVFSTVWFSVLLLFSLIALLVSLRLQVAHAWSKTFAAPQDAAGEHWRPVSMPDHLHPAAWRRAGYLLVFASDGKWRYLKNPWGYWGNPLLHSGMAIILAASLLMALTQQRSLLHLNEGEVHAPGTEWLVSECGPLADTIVFPEAIGLDYVLPEFWGQTGELKRLSSGLRFVDPRQGTISQVTLTVNAIVTRHGFRLYQGTNFGHSFYLEFNLGEGRQQAVIFDIKHPSTRGEAGYGNFRVVGVPYLIKAKYVLDPQTPSTLASTPRLVLRLVDDKGTVLAEQTLAPDASGTFGPYGVRLSRVGRWSSIIVTRLHGMGMVFFGFFLVIVGSGLIYFSPVREILVYRAGEGFLLAWRAGKFALFYQKEYESLLNSLRTWNHS